MNSAIAVAPSRQQGEKDVFIDQTPVWRQPGQQGAFGGAVMARSLMAAALTAKPGFLPYSMQCIFVSNAQLGIAITYHVDRLRDSRGSLSRRVRAEQKGQCVLEALFSFSQDTAPSNSKGRQLLHQPPAPSLERLADKIEHLQHEQDGQNHLDQPFEFLDPPSLPANDPSSRRMYRWMRVKSFDPKTSDHISAAAHIAAVLFMSDHRFVGMAVRAHRIPRFTAPSYVDMMLRGVATSLQKHPGLPPIGPDDEIRDYLSTIAKFEAEEIALQHTPEEAQDPSLRVTREFVTDVAVSLSHTMFFHAPSEIRADEWVLMEMGSSWTGRGRGLVEARVWSRDGVLLASCSQEGIVKLKAKEDSTGKSKL